MNAADIISAEDLAVFAPMAKRYFETIGGDAPEFGESSIQLGDPDLGNLAGFIPVSGSVNGWVALTFNSDVADALLTALDEPGRDEETRRDLVGEVASTIASNARWHFGKRLAIEPALATSGGCLPAALPVSPMTFQIPFTWRGFGAALLISLHPETPTS